MVWARLRHNPGSREPAARLPQPPGRRACSTKSAAASAPASGAKRPLEPLSPGIKLTLQLPTSFKDDDLTFAKIRLDERSMRAAVAELDDDAATLDELAADFAAIYLNNAYGASPYESVWLHDEHLACQQPMFDQTFRTCCWPAPQTSLTS